MKAIHGGKAKNDKIDAHKIAVLLRGGMIPTAYVYPAEMRSTRDLLRRRMHLMHHRSELLAHVQNTNSQYNLPDIGKKLVYKTNREGVAERFPDAGVRSSVAMDLKLIGAYDDILRGVELEILRNAKQHDAPGLSSTRHRSRRRQDFGSGHSLRSHDIRRFPRVQDFVSYCRLVKSKKESAGKCYGTSGNKIGNAPFKVGVLGSGRVVLERQSRRSGLPGSSGKETRQGQGSDRSGAQTGSIGVFHALAQRGFRYETILEPLIWSGAGEPDA
jgi:hypothetical protein